MPEHPEQDIVGYSMARALGNKYTTDRPNPLKIRRAKVDWQYSMADMVGPDKNYISQVKSMIMPSSSYAWFSPDDHETGFSGPSNVDERSRILAEMLIEHGKPSLTTENEYYLSSPRGGWFQGPQVEPARRVKGTGKAKIYVDPTKKGGIGTYAYKHGEQTEIPQLGPKYDEYDWVGISVPEMTVIEEMAHLQSHYEGSKQSDLSRIGLDKLGTGKNLRALVERVMVNTGQGIMSRQLNKTKKARLKKINKKMMKLGAWLAGYDRKGSEEYYAHKVLSPKLKKEYIQRIAGYQ